jgi:hypothetical protein
MSSGPKRRADHAFGRPQVDFVAARLKSIPIQRRQVLVNDSMDPGNGRDIEPGGRENPRQIGQCIGYQNLGTPVPQASCGFIGRAALVPEVGTLVAPFRNADVPRDAGIDPQASASGRERYGEHRTVPVDGYQAIRVSAFGQGRSEIHHHLFPTRQIWGMGNECDTHETSGRLTAEYAAFTLR